MEKQLNRNQIQEILNQRPQTMSKQQVIDGLVARGYQLEGLNAPKTVTQKVTGALKERASNVVEAVKDVGQAQGVTETLAQAGRVPLRALGQAAGAVGDVIGETVVNPTLQATGLDKPLAQGVQAVAESGVGQAIKSGLSQVPQPVKEAVGDVANVAGLVTGGTGAKVAGQTVGKGVVKGAGAVANTASDVIDTAGNIVKPITERVSAVKRNIGANLENVAEKQKIIDTLPTETSKKAAYSGIDIADINTINRIDKTNLPLVRQIVKQAKDFSTGVANVDPIETVGKPIVARLKELTKNKEAVGKQLNDVAKNLGVVEKPELLSAVFSRLQGVRGLEDLKLKNGKLDFSNTTLLSAATKSDRSAIQEAFNQATRWGNGEKAHKYRQELFEVLGGKKRSLANITDTQENAFEAVRKGLADVLETKNPEYKKLNQQYAKIVQPLKDLRKLSKTLDPNDTQDILDLSAGVLARRLSSAGAGNAQLRKALQTLDNATQVKGQALSKTQDLLDAYNVIGKYYDIAAKTGFKGQIEQAIDKSISGVAIKALEKTIGQSPAARQKALQELLDSLK